MTEPTADNIRAALRETSGNVTAAAALLGVSRMTLYRRMKAYGITTERIVRA